VCVCVCVCVCVFPCVGISLSRLLTLFFVYAPPGKAADISSKIRDDLIPTMKNGWKFWVPAASINFYAIPVEKQVCVCVCAHVFVFVFAVEYIF